MNTNPTSRLVIERCTSIDDDWLGLREALWPHCSQEEHLAEMASFIAAPTRFAQFLAYAEPRKAVGLAEASVRTDYVNGATTSPVAFLEGLYVVPAARLQGVAAALVCAVCDWARTVGCTELASDVQLENEASHAVHCALGFQETERVVFYRKALPPS